MDRKKLMLLLGALVVAMGTAMAARSLFSGAGAPQAEAVQVPMGPKVLVAQRALPVGTIITADSVAYQAWPKEMVQDAYFLDGEADMGGWPAAYPRCAGQPRRPRLSRRGPCSRHARSDDPGVAEDRCRRLRLPRRPR
jgi:pilus assembly protein CpaB